jgi:DNA polymerase (family 10)
LEVSCHFLPVLSSGAGSAPFNHDILESAVNPDHVTDLVKISNKHISAILHRISSLKERMNEDRYRVRAYRNAAINVANCTTVLSEVKSLPKITGVGDQIRSVIQEIISKGTCTLLLEMEARVQDLEKTREDLPYADLLKIPGIGYRKAESLSSRGINNRQEYLAAIDSNKVPDPGNQLRRAIQFSYNSSRVDRDVAEMATRDIFLKLKDLNAVERISYAGSMRRETATVGDVDIIIATEHPKIVMEEFCKMQTRQDLIVRGDEKCSMFIPIAGRTTELRCDLLCVNPRNWGSALCYFTGSVNHNVRLRALAKQKGYRVNEHGIFLREGGKRVGGEREDDLYKLLGIEYVPPTMRSE